ncbi:WYL domain-containing protein [Chloroflexi bacterium TSY]|nr:WYL domain-containing protein [Chloroflexi bacterium TSY]
MDLLSLGTDVEVVEPTELRQQIADELRRILLHYL